MKVTRLGPAQTRLTSGLGVNAGSIVPPGGGADQILTSNGSNQAAWGSNVATIRANGSNANLLLGPHINFAAGSNIVLSTASNTMTIASTATAGSDPASDVYVWMPLTSLASNSLTPELVWDDDDSLIPTLVLAE